MNLVFVFSVMVTSALSDVCAQFISGILMGDSFQNLMFTKNMIPLLELL